MLVRIRGQDAATGRFAFLLRALSQPRRQPLPDEPAGRTTPRVLGAVLTTIGTIGDYAVEGLLISFSQVAGQALYFDDLFSSFTIEPDEPRERGRMPALLPARS